MGQIFRRPTLTGTGTGGNTLNSGRLDDCDYDGYAVTSSDSVDLPNGPCDALYATAAGNIAVQLVRTDASGNVTVMGTTVLTSVAAGEILPIQVSRVRATSTTATGIFALYRRSR